MSADYLTIILPLPPSANALTVTLKGGKRVSSASYKDWTQDAGVIAHAAWKLFDKPEFAKPLSIHIEAGIDHKRDLSNLVKPIEDMLVKSIPGLPDDRYNDRLLVERTSKLEGEVRITITSLSGERAQAVKPARVPSIGQALPKQNTQLERILS